MGEAAQYAIKMHHVTKTFGKVVANKNVDLELKTGRGFCTVMAVYYRGM
ncbi:hypothetical protein [[Ruminococcus] torques]